MGDNMTRIFDRLKRLAAEAGLPGVEEGTSYGNPSLKVGGKGFVSVRDDETLVLSIRIGDKEPLLEMAPEIYFQTPHYAGWPSLPVRAAVIGDEELRQRLVEAWLFRAPKRLAATIVRLAPGAQPLWSSVGYAIWLNSCAAVSVR